jgi:hypothetical protein
MATESDQTNTGVITTIVVVGTFAMISISAMITALVRSEHALLDGERPTNADLDTVAALDKQQLATLTAPPRWVAAPGGKVHIPIDRAMRLVVDEYQKDPAAASPPPPPGLVMTPPTAPVGSPANPSAPGTAQPTPAVPSPAAPNPAAPDPAATPRVVPVPSAPGPAPTPAPAGRP